MYFMVVGATGGACNPYNSSDEEDAHRHWLSAADSDRGRVRNTAVSPAGGMTRGDTPASHTGIVACAKMLYARLEHGSSVRTKLCVACCVRVVCVEEVVADCSMAAARSPRLRGVHARHASHWYYMQCLQTGTCSQQRGVCL